MSYPINGEYINGNFTNATLNFRISSHDEASGKFSGVLFENQHTPNRIKHYIDGWFKFNRDKNSTSFYFKTPTDTWNLESPDLEGKNQFMVMNATRTPNDRSKPPTTLVLDAANKLP
ncbi:hypothetical protein [Pseudomonas atacamensis]|jgi:hypothetical protein|uniref:hypothetical protein n=1 Tax=Pseudomonas atacamensis TaxID=2565368 RepID=UPI00300F277D